MPLFPPAPAPVSGLARYRQLAPNAGVHVSPIQLGAMSIGNRWGELGMGQMDKESSFKLLDTYYELGGNFIDTSNNYQEESSEEFIGEWAETRGIRDQLFIATKYSTSFKLRDSSIKQKVLYGGNNSKSLHLSVEASLKKLRTSYIDLLYVHFWDFSTSIEEVMHSLHNLVVRGKVLYLGASDTPAWVVSSANQYARCHGLTPFVIYQGCWNIMERSFERDIIPMARAEGMALAPFGVLAHGKIRTDAEEEKRRQTGEGGRTIMNPNWERTEKEKLVCQALENVVGEVGAKSITSVAIAYLMHKTTFVFPVIGGRKPEQLKANIEALDIALSKEQMKHLDSVMPVDLGFPGWMIGTGENYNGVFLASGNFDKQPLPEPIRPQVVRV